MLASYLIHWWWRQWPKPKRWCPRRGRLPWTRPDGPGSPSQGWPAHLVMKRRETEAVGGFTFQSEEGLDRGKWPHVLLRRRIKVIKCCYCVFSEEKKHLVLFFNRIFSDRRTGLKGFEIQQQCVTEAWISHLIEPNPHHPSSRLIPPFLSSLCPRCLLRFMLQNHLLLRAVWENWVNKRQSFTFLFVRKQTNIKCHYLQHL